ncbi:hypothetical protein PVAP13_8KG204400 [Panicum virgatum]|uniref:Uncharacterized protein n=1 Tax=Panicum virgatum TaxID=38727 RepID=A0A8T0PSN4_PANVG|nr:hypothetical protein PVAP13_8KG204400 [Panicum virgatum]
MAMKTELMTTMISLIFLMHTTTTISPGAQPPWLFSLLSISLAAAAVTLPFTVVTSRCARGRNNNGAAAASIPGPRGWPLVGSLPAVSGPLMHRRLAALADAHGARRLMSLTLGAMPVVISSHQETAREILSGATFVDRPPKAVARELMFCRAIGFAPAGEYWRRLRRAAGVGMLSPHCLAALEGIRRRVADGVVRHVADQMERSGEVAMRALLQRASLESMAGSVLGLEVGAVSDELGEMVREGYELVGTFNLGDYYYTTLRLAARVRGYFGKIIEERRVAGDCQERDDLLSYMLTLPEDERLEDSDVNAVLWVRNDLSREINAAVGPHPLTDSDISRLHFLQRVIKATLRMHPPGPLLSWARLAVRDTRVSKHAVPAGTTAMVNMWAISRDEAVWGDPLAFRPERFGGDPLGGPTGGTHVSVLGSDLRLAPFGLGRREYEWSPAAKPVKLGERLRLSKEMKEPLVCRAVRGGEEF